MPEFNRKLRLSIHPDIVDRAVPNDQLYASGWKNVELTPEELIASIKEGHPYSVQLRGHRDKKHFFASDIASADIDGGLSIAEALQNPLVRDYATILYTTLRHQASAPRFRVVFALPRTITEASEMSAVARALCLRLSGDSKVVDPSHLFFGNRNAEIELLGREISSEVLEQLIAQGMDRPEPDTVGSIAAVMPGRAPSRSGLSFSPGQQVQLAKGGLRRVSELIPKSLTRNDPFNFKPLRAAA